MLQFYLALVLPLILYSTGIMIWGSPFLSYLKKIKTIQNQARKIVAKCHYRDCANLFYSQFKILKIDDMKLLNLLTALFTIEISIGFAIIFLNSPNIQIDVRNNVLTIRV